MDHTYLPQIGAFDPFLGRIVFEGVGETGQTKKNIFVGSIGKKWHRKSGKEKVARKKWSPLVYACRT
jgi:hypothetical protein